MFTALLILHWTLTELSAGQSGLSENLLIFQLTNPQIKTKQEKCQKCQKIVVNRLSVDWTSTSAPAKIFRDQKSAHFRSAAGCLGGGTLRCVPIGRILLLLECHVLSKFKGTSDENRVLQDRKNLRAHCDENSWQEKNSGKLCLYFDFDVLTRFFRRFWGSKKQVLFLLQMAWERWMLVFFVWFSLALVSMTQSWQVWPLMALGSAPQLHSSLVS